jgi:hypothetical protein
MLFLLFEPVTADLTQNVADNRLRTVGVLREVCSESLCLTMSARIYRLLTVLVSRAFGRLATGLPSPMYEPTDVATDSCHVK